jgi:hypothetical protein
MEPIPVMPEADAMPMPDLQAQDPGVEGDGGALRGREATVAVAAKIVRELINEIGLEGVLQMLQEMGGEAGVDTGEIAQIAAGGE